MTTKDEALRLALEALERVNTVDDDCDILSPQLADAVTESIDAIRESMAQPAVEPVVLQVNGIPPVKSPPCDVIDAAFHVSDWAERNGWKNWRIGRCCSEDYSRAALLSADAQPSGCTHGHCEATAPFGTFVERNDGTTEFRRTGEAHSPTAHGYKFWTLYTTPPAQPEHGFKIWKETNSVWWHCRSAFGVGGMGDSPESAVKNWALNNGKAHPSEWVSIGDDEIYGMYNEPRSDAEMIEFARAIESKLKEKNHGK